MTTKIAATFVLILAAINFFGWMAGIDPPHETIVVVEPER